MDDLGDGGGGGGDMGKNFPTSLLIFDLKFNFAGEYE